MERTAALTVNMDNRLLPVLMLLLLVGVGTGAGDQLSLKHKEHLRSQVEWKLKLRHLDRSGQPLAGRRPAWEPVGREDLLQVDDNDEESQVWEDGKKHKQESLEPVPADVAWVAATALVSSMDIDDQVRKDQQMEEHHGQQAWQSIQDTEGVSSYTKHMTGWKGLQHSADEIDAIEI